MKNVILESPRALTILRWTPAAGYVLSAIAWGSSPFMLTGYMLGITGGLVNVTAGLLLQKQTRERRRAFRTGILALAFGALSAQFIIYGMHFVN